MMPKRRYKYKRIVIEVPEELHADIKMIAAASRVSMLIVVEQALGLFINQLQERERFRILAENGTLDK